MCFTLANLSAVHHKMCERSSDFISKLFATIQEIQGKQFKQRAMKLHKGECRMCGWLFHGLSSHKYQV